MFTEKHARKIWRKVTEAHELLGRRIHALIEATRFAVPRSTAVLAGEMVDANESRIALDMLSEVLAERGARVPCEIVAEFEALANELGLDRETADRLRR